MGQFGLSNFRPMAICMQLEAKMERSNCGKRARNLTACGGDIPRFASSGSGRISRHWALNTGYYIGVFPIADHP